MLALVISSDSESDSDFERDLAEAKRRSNCMESESLRDAATVILVLYLINILAVCVSEPHPQ